MSQDIFAQYFAGQPIEKKPAEGHDGPYAEYFSSLRPAEHTKTQEPQNQKPADHVNSNTHIILPECKSDPYDLAILGGSLVLPECGVLSCDIYCRGGKIASLHQGEPLPARQVVNANGQMVLPGIFDPHIHMGITDSLANELQTETCSGLIGGVTTAGLMVGADLAYVDNFASIADQVNQLSRINIMPHFIIASQEQIDALPQAVKTLGIRSFKVFLHGVPGLIESKDDTFIVDTMRALKATGEKCILCVHTENHALVMSATERVRSRFGDNATLLDWAETHPEISEEEAVIRIAYFAEKLKQPTYIVHISSGGAIEKLREIKKTNPYVICETVSPYLMLDPEKIQCFTAKMEPPIRGGRHIEAMWQGLQDGVIDTIGTDNVSWDLNQKNLGKTIWEAMPGYPAMATHLPSILTGGFSKRGFDLTALVAKMTSAPAKVFGLYPQKGTLLPGSDADIVLVDLQKVRKVDHKNLRSRSDFSIYQGQSFIGWPSVTIVGGHIAAIDGEILGEPQGRLLLPKS